MLLFVLVLGLVVGSFLSALTWRVPRGINFVNDRSKCDNCSAKISWYDNIPLLSYLVLSGRCRNCGKKISLRYPLIELFTGFTFVMVYFSVANCTLSDLTFSGDVCGVIGALGYFALPYLLFVVTLMIAIFVTDFEYQIIPDEFIFLLLGINMLVIPLLLVESMYDRLFGGFLTSLFLLLLHIFTQGRGMGLGDVKLALFAGSFLGLQYSVSWLFLSFVIGALIGVCLVLLRKAEFGRKIAFGPFLVISFFLLMLWGEQISVMLLPYGFLN